MSFPRWGLCTWHWPAWNSLCPHHSPGSGLHTASSFSSLKFQLKKGITLQALSESNFPGHPIAGHFLFPSKTLPQIVVIAYLFVFITGSYAP